MGDAGAYAELTFVLEVSASATRVLASRLVLSDLAARVRQRRREEDAVQLAWGGVVAAFVESRQGEQASISCSVVVDAVLDAVVAAAAAASNTRDGSCIFGRAASSNCTSSGAHRSTDKPLGGRQGGRLLCDMVVVVGGVEASLCRCREPLAMMVEPDCLPPALHCRKPSRSSPVYRVCSAIEVRPGTRACCMSCALYPRVSVCLLSGLGLPPLSPSSGWIAPTRKPGEKVCLLFVGPFSSRQDLQSHQHHTVTQSKTFHDERASRSLNHSMRCSKFDQKCRNSQA